MPYTEINDIEEFKDIISKQDCVVIYSAKWCKSCCEYENAYNVISNLDEYTDVPIYKIDIDKVEDCKDRCNITSIPLTVIYKDSNETSRFVGNNQRKLVDFINEYIITIPVSP